MLTEFVTGEWTEYPAGAAYRVPVYLEYGPDGRVSAVAATLPGVAGQGKDDQEALANVREALAGALRVYREEGVPAPWVERRGDPGGPWSRARWVLVLV
jgi:predicted RNase H-like HicB family nuclease